ncbi:ABC transporter ATP-binding protein [Candidatus Saccharibacteria bacterium]|nr:ABC transporter ATP-binding protein [Candidatus Saccharibacteria bacterium]
MNIIETKKLTKYYGKSLGIEDVDLEVREGEIFGFIGPNGAGKSTTIRTLLGLIHPTGGSATIFGRDVTKFGPEINAQIGYLPSEVFYYDDMKVIDLLRYSGSFYGMDAKKVDVRIRELAKYLDLDLKRKIDDLSYGNKKKVGIVQGLLHQPKLIILDEPTGGLDPLMQQRFFDLLREENKKGATILFSSHILSEVQRLCDRVAIIKDGKIIRVEKISNLADNTHKKFKLETATPVEKGRFAGLKGMTGMTIQGNSISFLYRGPMNDVTKIIASLNLTNLIVEDPDLEEIFMHYYQTGK